MMLANYMYNASETGIGVTLSANPERILSDIQGRVAARKQQLRGGAPTPQHTQEAILSNVILIVLVHPASHAHNDLRRQAAIRVAAQIQGITWKARQIPSLRLFVGAKDSMLELYREACRKLPRALECEVVPTELLVPAAAMEYMIPYTADDTGLLLLDDRMHLSSKFMHRLQAVDRSGVTCLLPSPANASSCPGIAFYVPAPLMDLFIDAQNASHLSAIAAQAGVYTGSIPLVHESH